MFHRWNGWSHKNPSAAGTLVFYYAAVCLLAYCGGEAEMIGSSTPILAMIGGDVVLPCHLEPQTDVSALTLEWARLDLNPRFVHVRRDGVDLLIRQNPSFVGRTSLWTEKLQRGDMSLTLSKVKLSDGGKYRCHVPDLGTSTVELNVGAAPSPAIIIKDISAGQVVLQCESKGWYPEPEVLWLDSVGNLLPAGPTETFRGPEDLYTISSKVTVERKHRIIFTCRVQQTNINQTRDTGIQIEDEVCASASRSVAPIIIVSLICLLLFVAVFALWILGRKKTNKKDHHNETPEDEKGENEPLSEESKNMKDMVEEKLHKKEEEKDDMLQMISILNYQRKELETARDKLISELKEVEERWRKNERELKKVNGSFIWDKGNKENSLLKTKIDLENKKKEQKQSLQSIEERLQKINRMISKMTERKEKVENQIKKLSTGEKKQQEEAQEGRQVEESEKEDESQELMVSTNTEMTSHHK